MLDLIGDLALLGLPVQGHVKAMRSGHALHHALVAELRANPSCWTVEVPGAPGEQVDVPGVALPRLQPAPRA
jgi:UDP-3-O-acyl-N-acetylglucosamine deacetylase